MAELGVIVEKLNAAPFKLNYSLVTFDELTPFDLVLLLQKVVVYLDDKHDLADPRNDPLELTKKRLSDFLSMLKFGFPREAGDAERFKDDLVTGERKAIYPVLYYLLSKLNWCKTRAYIAKFLARIDIPPEFHYHDVVKDQLEKYEGLKKSFSELHKKVEKLRRDRLAPEELFDQLSQLQEEKTQLLEKISQLQKRTDEMGPKFSQVFEATSELRQAREEQGRLQKNGLKQRHALTEVKKKHATMQRRLEQMQKTHSENASAQDMMDDLRSEVKEKKRLLTNELPLEISAARRRLRQIEAELTQPARTDADVDDMHALVDTTQAELESLKNEISRLQRMGGEKDGLKMFHQQASMWQKKLEQEETELAQVRGEAEEVNNKMEDLQGRFQVSLHQQGMRPGDFNEYAVNLREKTAEHKRKKQEIAAIRAESVVLSRTEAILRSRTADLDVLLRKIEEESVSRRKSTRGVESSDESHKGKPLEELSRLIQRFDEQLSDKKRSVAPLVEQRRKLLPQKEELQKVHREKKQIYDSIAVGLESERIQLERDCEMYQEEALRHESRYHLIHCEALITEVSLEKVREEEDFERGNGKLLRDFQCYKDLYQQKIQQQEQMSKELRKQQRELKECEGSNSEQRKIFEDLRRLLYVKLQVHKNQQQPNAIHDGVIDLGQDVGGANVMTIAQH